MKDKILKLIYAELKATNGETKFHSNNQNWFGPIKPYYGYSLVTERNDTNSNKSEEFDYLNYVLKFEDGEPDIIIVTRVKDFTEKKKLIYKSFWGQKRYKTIISHVIKTNVTCGHVFFELTDEEASELFEETKYAYKKYLSLKDGAADKALNDKLDLRLKKLK